MRCANSRAGTSFGPPAANGLTMVSGRVGQSSAVAPVAKVRDAAATSAVRVLRIIPPESFAEITPLLDYAASSSARGSFQASYP